MEHYSMFILGLIKIVLYYWWFRHSEVFFHLSDSYCCY